jgi:hypothetical protein
VPKFKSPRARGAKTSNRSAIPCLILLVMGMLFVFLLFYGVLKSA